MENLAALMKQEGVLLTNQTMSVDRVSCTLWIRYVEKMEPTNIWGWVKSYTEHHLGGMNVRLSQLGFPGKGRTVNVRGRSICETLHASSGTRFHR